MCIYQIRKKRRKTLPNTLAGPYEGVGAGAGTTPGPDPIMLKMDDVDEKKKREFPTVLVTSVRGRM